MDTIYNSVLYVLELENNKFYLGLTDKNINTVYDEHVNGTICEWTKIYKPINIDRIMKDCDQFDLNIYTIEYMLKYEIENVRSDTYKKQKLTRDELVHFQKTVCSYTPSVCIRCGRNSHIFKDCYANYDVNNKAIDSDSDVFQYNINFYKNDFDDIEYEDDFDDIEYEDDQNVLDEDDQNVLDEDEERFNDGIWYCSVCLQNFEFESDCKKHEKKCLKRESLHYLDFSDIYNKK